MHHSLVTARSRFLIYAAASAVLLAAPAIAQESGGQESGQESASSQESAPRVTIETNHGAIVVELDREKAPITVANFLQYVESGWYDGTVFHRVMDGFMIQGGGFDPELQKKDTRPPIENEAKNGLKNDRGTIAMARTSDPHSATAQFFINLVDNDGLNYSEGEDGYAVFGKVVEGMDVVDAIAKVEVKPGQTSGAQPVETVLMTKVGVQ